MPLCSVLKCKLLLLYQVLSGSLTATFSQRLSDFCFLILGGHCFPVSHPTSPNDLSEDIFSSNITELDYLSGSSSLCHGTSSGKHLNQNLLPENPQKLILLPVRKDTL